jgi:hypothetical protein
MAFIPRWGMAGLSVVGMISTVYYAFEENKQKGNPGDIQKIADHLDLLADQIDANGKIVNGNAAAVWNNNSGRGIEEFKKFVETKFPAYLPKAGTSGPSALSDYIRRDATAHRQCADIIQKYNESVEAMEVATLILLLSFVFWSEVYGWAGTAAGRLVTALADRNLLLVQLLNETTQAILTKLIEYALGSAFYAVLDAAASDSADAAFGAPQPSLGDQWHRAWTDWVSVAAFYGIYDATAALGDVVNLGKTPQPLRNIALVVPGATAYTYIDNLLNGKRPGASWPTPNNFVQKFLIALGQVPFGKG